MGETPVPIPNTMVKTQPADGTTLETMWESRWLLEFFYGELAQLGEHLPCKQGVESSNLLFSTRMMKRANDTDALSDDRKLACRAERKSGRERAFEGCP